MEHGLDELLQPVLVIKCCFGAAGDIQRCRGLSGSLEEIVREGVTIPHQRQVYVAELVGDVVPTGLAVLVGVLGKLNDHLRHYRYHYRS